MTIDALIMEALHCGENYITNEDRRLVEHVVNRCAEIAAAAPAIRTQILRLKEA